MGTGAGDELLSCAARLFAAKGYDATSLQDVVEAAGLSKGALYYYYASKDELLYQIHHRFLTYELEQADRIVAQNLDPRETLRRLIVAHVAAVAKFQNEFTVSYRDMHRLGPEHGAAVKDLRERLHWIFRRTIIRGQDEGSFRRDVPAFLQAFAVLGMCNLMFSWYRPEGSLSPEQIGGYLAEVAIGGLEAPNPSG